MLSLFSRIPKLNKDLAHPLLLKDLRGSELQLWIARPDFPPWRSQWSKLMSHFRLTLEGFSQGMYMIRERWCWQFLGICLSMGKIMYGYTQATLSTDLLTPGHVLSVQRLVHGNTYYLLPILWVPLGKTLSWLSLYLHVLFQNLRYGKSGISAERLHIEWVA